MSDKQTYMMIPIQSSGSGYVGRKTVVDRQEFVWLKRLLMNTFEYLKGSRIIV